MAEVHYQEKPHQFHGAGLECHERYKKWWSAARQSDIPPSPREFLHNFGFRQEAVEEILRDALNLVCADIGPNYAGPGVIDYFSHYQSHNDPGLFGGSDYCALSRVLEDIHEHTLMSNGGHWSIKPTEQDLLSLADAAKPKSDAWETVMAFCLAGSYNSGFLQSMFGKIPEGYHIRLDFSEDSFRAVGKPGFRQELDQSCVLGIRKALPNLYSVKLAGRWKKNAFIECLGLLLKSAKIKDLELQLPLLDEEESTMDIPLGVPKDLACNIQSLIIDTRHPEVDSDDTPWLGVGSLALQCLPHMPQLEILDMMCDTLHLQAAAPHIVRLLETCTELDGLTIEATASEEMPTTEAVLDILEALNHNSSLTQLDYVEKVPSFNSVLAREMLGVYETKLLQALQHSNTSLTRVNMKLEPADDPWGDFDVDGSKFRAQIDDVLLLNDYGRGVARDADTTIADFVELLHRANLSGDQLKRFRLNYGFLREMPGFWSTHVSSTTFSSVEVIGDRKRKRTEIPS